MLRSANWYLHAFLPISRVQTVHDWHDRYLETPVTINQRCITSQNCEDLCTVRHECGTVHLNPTTLSLYLPLVQSVSAERSIAQQCSFTNFQPSDDSGWADILRLNSTPLAAMQTPRGAVVGRAVFVGVCRFHTSRQVKNKRGSKLPLLPHYYERLTPTAYSIPCLRQVFRLVQKSSIFCDSRSVA